MIPETSVIIACYNVDDYLPEALESVCAQTRPVREIIIVDDGSDRPVQRPANWQGPPLKIFRTSNRGAAAARNFGVSLAGGNFIAFLDADDAWAPTKIEMQEELLASDTTGVAVFTRRVERVGWNPCPPIEYPSPDISDDEFWIRMWVENFITLSAIMLRRDVFLRVGGFDERLPPCEDWELWFRVLTQGRILQVPSALCYRRIHPQQLTKKFDKIMVYHRKCRLILMRDHGRRLASAGLSIGQQRKQAEKEYREHLLILYFQRRFVAARRLLWKYLMTHPFDVSILKYALLSLLPGQLLAYWRDDVPAAVNAEMVNKRISEGMRRP